jgi:hypothetical protein
MEASATMATVTESPRTGERIAGWFVLVVMTLACTVFWVGIPAAGLWGLSKVTDTSTTHFLAAVFAIPAAMALFCPVLFWLNGLYLRVTGVIRRLEADDEDTDWRRRVRGPLEPILLASLGIELILLFIWFFFLAENPPEIVI